MLFSRKETEKEKGIYPIFDKENTNWSMNRLHDGTRFIFLVDLFFHRSKRHLPRREDPPLEFILIDLFYFRENIFIKKVVRRRIFPSMATMVRSGSIALLFPLIEVWKIVVIAVSRK